MRSAIRSAGVVIAVMSTLVACGSDAKSSTSATSVPAESPAPSATNSTPAPYIETVPTTEVVPATDNITETVAPSTTAVVELPSICTLVAPELVTAVLGAAPADAGSEQVFEPGYKNCRWLTPTSLGNANALEAGVVIRKSADASGFAHSSGVGDPTPVEGVGDSATYSNNNDPNFEAAQFIAGQGLISVAITANYGGNTPHGPDVEGALAAIATQIFSQLDG
ncbi:MAG: hypothetical protein ABI949_00300 [Ilumatobacteraceae bacterium]